MTKLTPDNIIELMDEAIEKLSNKRNLLPQCPICKDNWSDMFWSNTYICVDCFKKRLKNRGYDLH